MQKESTTKLTGVWRKEGKFGEFYSSSNVSKAQVLALLEKSPNDFVQIIVDPTRHKGENSPDFSVRITPGFIKG